MRKNGSPQELDAGGNRCIAPKNLCESVKSVDNQSFPPLFVEIREDSREPDFRFQLSAFDVGCRSTA